MTLPVASMPAFPGLEVPHDFWWAIPPPIPLAAMPYPPTAFDWEKAAALGFRRVVCLTDATAPYDPAPLGCMAVHLEDLYHGDPPYDPARERDAIRRIVDNVSEWLDVGEGVLVHCAGGTGRSGTVVGAALAARGEDPDEVALWLDEVHRVRGRRGWPESSWQRDLLKAFAP